GDVHAFIRRQIAAHGLEDPEGFIFATGRDAGIPHSKGGDSAPLRLGESIVFDIFPCEAGGGYFFDMTRTFCLGYAPDNIARLYEHTQGCIEEVLGHIAAGEKTAGYQTMACAYFHALGHPTIEDAPTTDTGYTHGLGHGIGLNVHESPWFRGSDTLAPGHVFTIEPGLYYPDEGMGCRLEDVIWLDDDGIPHNLTDYPYTLVIPVGKGKPGQREEQK
ncbi:MAG: aminopeptidase P family protein, partial [Anaerolineae bacterium]|nr:aminopeptidase P family protein [Anaerolineae bacterium]